MRILYVTDTWTALLPVLYEEQENLMGMPGFWRPLKALLEQGHEIDVIFYDHIISNREKQYRIKSSWFSKVKIVDHIYVNYSSGIKKVYGRLKAFFALKSIVFQQLGKTHYDFVYGQGPLSEAANVACKKKKIPFGMRCYGDSLLSLIEKKGLFYAMLSRPIDIIAYTTKKSFLLATNDGSRVDELVRRLNRGVLPYPFYFWINGVDRPECSSIKDQKYDSPYLLYTARIVESKRQDRAIELLHCLSQKGIHLQLLLAGSIDSPDLYAHLLKQAEMFQIAEQIHFLGSRNAEELSALSSKAVACLSFYDDTNLGNCLIEYLCYGGAVISLDDNSLNEIITNGENGFLVKDMPEAAEVVERLLKDSELCEKIKREAKARADRQFDCWQNRVQREISLIMTSSMNKCEQ